MLLGYDQRNHEDSDLVELINEIAKLDINITQNRNNLRDLVTEATDKIKAYNKIYYDKRHCRPMKYKEGDYVLIRDLQGKPGESRKLKPSYKGPYTIAKVLNKNRYVVTDITGFNITSKPYNSILSCDKIKPWVRPVVSPEHN